MAQVVEHLPSKLEFKPQYWKKKRKEFLLLVVM
jgi:hypothetical protein